MHVSKKQRSNENSCLPRMRRMLVVSMLEQCENCFQTPPPLPANSFQTNWRSSAPAARIGGSE